MQRQPTPRAEPLRKRHFLKRCDALKKLGENPQFLNDLSDMPSRCVTLNKNVNKKRDTKVGKAVKGWDANTAISVVHFTPNAYLISRKTIVKLTILPSNS